MEAYQQLEHNFANLHLKGAYTPEQCVAVSNGTSALHIAFEALQRKNSAALIPDFTMVACARAATMAGFDVVPVDCNEEMLVTASTVSTKITERTSVVMPVHIYGRLCDMQALTLLAEQFDLDVIEDMAEAHGCMPHPESYAACWSFYKNKIVHGEEGGMIVFRDKSKATLARMLRSQGFTAEHDFMHVPRGINARMSNLNARPIMASLAALSINSIVRNAQINVYNTYIPSKYHMPARNSPWVYDLRIPSSDKQDMLVRALRERGIEARHAFKPISCQPEYRHSTGEIGPNALKCSQEIIYLPLGEHLTVEDIYRYCHVFNEIVKQIL